MQWLAILFFLRAGSALALTPVTCVNGLTPVLIPGIEKLEFQRLKMQPALVIRQKRFQESLDLYTRDLLALRARLYSNPEVKERMQAVKTVIYPTAGHDVHFPLILFPDAEWVIAIDQHDVLEDVVDSEVHATIHSHQGDWMRREYVSHVTQNVLGKILKSNPRNKIEEIYKITTEHSRSAILVRWSDQDGRIRSYLQITDYIDYFPALNEYWWSSLIPRQNFALIQKASMNLDGSLAFLMMKQRVKESPGALLISPTKELMNEKLYPNGDPAFPWLDRALEPLEYFPPFIGGQKPKDDYGSLDDVSVGVGQRNGTNETKDKI